MDKQVLDFVTEQTHALIAAPSCCKEAKEAAQSWLAAVGTEKETEETKKYIAELEEDLVSIDALKSLVTTQRTWLRRDARQRLPERRTAFVTPAELWKRFYPKRMKCWHRG